MDDTRKGEDVPSISEESWLQYFHNHHSNESLNPTQQNICNERRQAEFLESVVMTAEPLVLAGDFNINVNILTFLLIPLGILWIC